MGKPQIESEPKPPFPAKKLEKPGIEADLRPRPKYQAPNYRPANKLEGKKALITGGDSLSSTVGSEAWNSRDLKSRPH